MLFAWHWVIHSCSSSTEHNDIPTGLYLLESRATRGQNVLCHQQPVVLINLGTEGRNHLPSCVPIISRATALVCFHISGECSKTHARPTGALFSTLPWVIHFSSPSRTISSSLSSSPAQVYPSWLRKSLCCHFNIATRIHTNPGVGH